MSDPSLDIRPLDEASVGEVAGLHYDLFGDPSAHGHSVATLGPKFLANAFYRLNLDNPDFFCDVASVHGRTVAFSVYSTDKDTVFRHLVTKHLLGLVGASLAQLVRRPKSLPAFASNASYVFGERLDFLEGVPGWWIVAGVAADFRSAAGEARVGRRVASDLFDRMEERMQEAGCLAWYGVVDPANVAINKFLRRRGGREVGSARAQGMEMQYYVKRFAADGE